MGCSCSAVLSVIATWPLTVFFLPSESERKYSGTAMWVVVVVLYIPFFIFLFSVGPCMPGHQQYFLPSKSEQGVAVIIDTAMWVVDALFLSCNFLHDGHKQYFLPNNYCMFCLIKFRQLQHYCEHCMYNVTVLAAASARGSTRAIAVRSQNTTHKR